jgi:hypothetical protein
VGAACALIAAMSLLSAVPVSAAPPHAFLVASDMQGSASSDTAAAAGVSVGRIFDAPANSDIVSFSAIVSGATPGSDTFAGFALDLPPSAGHIVSAPRIFAESSGTQAADSARFATDAANRSAGLQFDLFGGAQATVAMQSSSASFGSGPFASIPSQGPAVFAFYNFPQAATGFSLSRAFGSLPRDNAIAATLNQAQQSAVGTTTPLSSPLISSLSAQGPFWYNAYSPATRGTSLTLTIPFQLARIPVKLRLGEQAVTSVEPTSLANQILGPAFASSAGSTYNAVTGGVTLALPLLSRRATVSLDGWYQTMQQNNQTPFNLLPYGAQAPVGLSVPGAVLYAPAIGGVQQYVGSASVALPVSPRLTVNGNFSEQLSGGVDLDTLTQSLTQHTTGYGGGVAYNFPKTHSSIEFSSNRNVYTDDNVPNYNFTQNQQNLYFSVKF